MNTAVLDIGKTNAKVVLVSDAGEEVAERRMPNRVLPGPPYPHFDAEALWAFALGALRDLAPLGISAIVPVTHGACAALVDEGGALALPVLDYEHPGPDAARATYGPPPFDETGSPPLAGGLNLGAQLHWLETAFPAGFSRAASLLPWPQYWAFRLCGVMAAEVTSLACHTDLWAPRAAAPSTLARRRGWDALLPPLRAAGEVLGSVRGEVAVATGLDPATPVLCGIHDSNASLLPYLGTRCGVLSTGTWIVAMALGTPVPALDPARDMLVNVAADGTPVPTALFMGGRLYEEALADGAPEAGAAREAGRRSARRLREIGARPPVHVEGPFASNEAFMAALSEELGSPARKGSGAGTTRGAALLARGVRADRVGRG